MKKEEDLLSSSNSVLQQEFFQNSDIKVDDSIIEQKSSSLEIDQDAPIYDKYNDDKADVVSFDITSNVNIVPNSYEGQPVFDEYSNEQLQMCTLTCNKKHLYDEHEDTSEQQIYMISLRFSTVIYSLTTIDRVLRKAVKKTTKNYIDHQDLGL